MHLQLDGRGPLHSQLTRALKTAVFAGRVHQGTRLPATRQLARELGVSRNTVLAAYEQLRAEGFVDGRVAASATGPLPRSLETSVPMEVGSGPSGPYASGIDGFAAFDWAVTAAEVARLGERPGG